ncbi:PREDICTED: uncharacterized protein LOC104595909 [Nelumbo nucifera]|uniref:Uncharacterized protein LOC104595909 n=1 Tax=Nelumbo nucifera TaxID=4432 RepID=A0A1U7ZSX8_NELNU|nr:PREDICTED: uncharacterized protein LOC104595909 [Nelumbo nucifera]
MNLDKSSLAGVNLEERELREYADVLRCAISDWPMAYLGLPLGDNPKKVSFWNPIVERFGKRLASLRKIYFSMRGRITLIRSTLANLPMYFLSVFKIPTKVSNTLEKLMRDFLWKPGEEKQDHMVSWEVVTRGKNLGDLGIENVRKRNRALLGKLLWRFPLERDKLWTKIVTSIHGLENNGWEPGILARTTAAFP